MNKFSSKNIISNLHKARMITISPLEMIVKNNKNQIKKHKSVFARPVGYPKTQIKKVGVIGAGLMGHGISLVSSFLSLIHI